MKTRRAPKNSERLTVSFPEGTLERIEETAGNRGLSAATFVRMTALERLQQERTQQSGTEPRSV